MRENDTAVLLKAEIQRLREVADGVVSSFLFGDQERGESVAEILAKIEKLERQLFRLEVEERGR